MLDFKNIEETKFICRNWFVLFFGSLLIVSTMACSKLRAYEPESIVAAKLISFSLQPSLQQLGIENIKKAQKKIVELLLLNGEKASEDGETFNRKTFEQVLDEDLSALVSNLLAQSSGENNFGLSFRKLPIAEKTEAELPERSSAVFSDIGVNESLTLAIALGNDDFCIEFLGNACEEVYQSHYIRWEQKKDKFAPEIRELMFARNVSLCSESSDIGAKLAEDLLLAKNWSDLEGIYEFELSLSCRGSGPPNPTYYAVEYRYKGSQPSVSDLAIDKVYTATFIQ